MYRVTVLSSQFSTDFFVAEYYPCHSGSDLQYQPAIAWISDATHTYVYLSPGRLTTNTAVRHKHERGHALQYETHIRWVNPDKIQYPVWQDKPELSCVSIVSSIVNDQRNG